MVAETGIGQNTTCQVFQLGGAPVSIKHNRLRSSLFLASATPVKSSTRQQVRYTEAIATSSPTLQACWLTSPVAMIIPKHRLAFCRQIPAACGSNSVRLAYICAAIVQGFRIGLHAQRRTRTISARLPQCSTLKTSKATQFCEISSEGSMQI